MNLVWRFTPIKSEIRESIKQKLKPHLGEDLSLEEFSLGFGYISFFNVKVGGWDKDYHLEIDEIQIGYSVHKLLFHNFDPLQVIESITFKNPQLSLLPSHQPEENIPDSCEQSLSRIVESFQKLTEIDRIFIQNGNILWEQSPDSLTRWVSGLEGVVIIKSEQGASVHLQGQLFGSANKALTLIGTINFKEKDADISAEIEQCQLKNGLPFLNGPSFSIREAVLNGKIKITCSSLSLKNLTLKGDLQVGEMKATVYDQHVFTHEFTIQFQGQRILLTPVSGSVEDGKFVLNGNLGEIFNPGIDFSIDFDDYSAKNLKISAPILELLNQGKIQGHLKLIGPRPRFVITGNIYASKLAYSIVPFYRSSLQFTFVDKIWTFHSIKTLSVAMEHESRGAIDFNKNTMQLSITSFKKFDSDDFVLIDRLNGTRMQYSTRMTGDFSTLTFTGIINGLFSHPNDTVLTTEAQFQLVNDYLTINTLKSFPATLGISAKIAHLWDDPTFEILEVRGVPFDSLSTSGIIDALSEKLRADFYFSGPVNFLTAKISLSNHSDGENFFSFIGTTRNLIRSQTGFKGKFTFQTEPDPIEGTLSLEELPDRILLSLKTPHVTSGRLIIGTGENDFIEGQFKADSISVIHYLATIPQLQQAVTDGTLSGDVQISGTRSDPLITFDLQGRQFIINENGYYTAHFKGTYQKNRLKFDEAWINHNNRAVFLADFTWNPQTDSVKAEFKGDRIESNFLASTILNDPQIIQGGLRYYITMQGLLQRPFISGTIVMRDGMIQGRAFDNLHIYFEDSIPKSSTLFKIQDHLFKILNFIYVDKEGYTIEATGWAGVDKKSPVDLNITVKGNVLAELPSIIEYFQNPNCIGDLELHITGTRESPQLDYGKLIIYTGSLEFESVIPKLTDLKAEIELPEGEEFIHIKTLQGMLEDRWVKIYNIPADQVANIQLQPWYFEELGLDLGVLILETDPRGIPLSVPGLMTPNDIGYFATEGKTPEEKFYFAGPVDLPHVRGKGKISESRVTFPFLESEEEITEESSTVIDFLMNINWDVHVVSGLGNRYFVDIPAVIGQVYLDLNIDDVSRGLTFTGRLVDESFRVEGQVESTRGRVEYLDMNFRVERFGAIFSRFELYPQVYGRAYTTVRDSTDFPRDIYLVLYAIDPETNQEVARGRWEDFRFKLVSSDPTIGETQENVLAYLGYSLDNISTKAGDVGLTLTENYIIRPLVRPLERKLERSLSLDYVRLRSNITSNLFYFGFQDRLKFLGNPNYYQPTVNNNIDPALLLFQSSEVTLGKYLMYGIYLSYSGQLVSVYDESKLGLNHRFGLEYRLLRNLLLEFEYDRFYFDPQYYSREALKDWRIRLRHSFNF
ncbi:MAG: hypothetical protein Kow0042_03070 [Calditrichia bacterium]